MKTLKIKVLLLLTLTTFIHVMAQEKKSFTLEDVMPGGNNYINLQPQNMYGLRWWGDVCIKADIEEIKTINPVNGRETPLITLATINDLLASKELGKISNCQSISFPYGETKTLLVTNSRNRVLIGFEDKELTLIWSQERQPKAANEEWNKHSHSLAYTIDNNLFVKTGKGNIQQVTNEPKGIVCGQSVHRQEFGITNGIFWSPKGNLLAFYRMDETMVTDYPQVNTSTRIATVEPDKYPMAGMTSHKVTVGVYNPATQQTLYLKAGDPTDRYFTNVSWSPDEKSVYVIELNRDQNQAQLVRYNASTGDKESVLLEETHPKYVEPQSPIVFLPWDSSNFIYQSQRDGFMHLYLYDTTGKLLKQLTQGEWGVKGILGFNEKTKEVIIKSTEISPLQTNAFAVNIKTGKRHLIGYDGGMHNVQLSESGKYVIDNYTSSKIPRKIDLVPTSGKGKCINLLTATNPQDAYLMPEVTLGTLKAADGKTDLYYRLIKPINYDPNKKYPAIVYLYGGPHAQMITDVRNYGAGGWDLYMAQQGYVMFTIDNRGSSNRGLEFENCTFRQLGTEEMKDQIKGVDFLKSLPYVDASRIGVHGWSFGGFMTTNLMLTYPEVFKAGVAGGPVINWEYYEVMYGERYMDTPQSNPEGYKKANLNLRAGNLKGRLEVIIGANDPTCVPQHSITFLRACIDAGTHPDYFIYPGDGHNMFGRDRVHLYEHITRYFEDHLK